MIADQAETIILLHGLWMNDLVLLPHQLWLHDEGYAVRRFSYPSLQGGLADNAHSLSRFINETPGAVIHLVAHSLGGLVALDMLSLKPDARIRRIVLMGTPYADCNSGTTLANLPVLNALVGRTLKDWFSLPHPALHADIEIGVIAGSRPIDLGRLLPGLARPNDGLVAVEETRIAAVRDSITLDVSHTGMLVSRLCTRQIARFLRTGRFVHA